MNINNLFTESVLHKIQPLIEEVLYNCKNNNIDFDMRYVIPSKIILPTYDKLYDIGGFFVINDEKIDMAEYISTHSFRKHLELDTVSIYVSDDMKACIFRKIPDGIFFGVNIANTEESYLYLVSTKENKKDDYHLVCISKHGFTGIIPVCVTKTDDGKYEVSQRAGGLLVLNKPNYTVVVNGNKKEFAIAQLPPISNMAEKIIKIVDFGYNDKTQQIDGYKFYLAPEKLLLNGLGCEFGKTVIGQIAARELKRHILYLAQLGILSKNKSVHETINNLQNIHTALAKDIKDMLCHSLMAVHKTLSELSRDKKKHMKFVRSGTYEFSDDNTSYELLYDNSKWPRKLTFWSTLKDSSLTCQFDWHISDKLTNLPVRVNTIVSVKEKSNMPSLVFKGDVFIEHPLYNNPILSRINLSLNIPTEVNHSSKDNRYVVIKPLDTTVIEVPRDELTKFGNSLSVFSPKEEPQNLVFRLSLEFPYRGMHFDYDIQDVLNAIYNNTTVPKNCEIITGTDKKLNISEVEREIIETYTKMSLRQKVEEQFSQQDDNSLSL